MSHPQPGITNRPPEHLLLAALAFVERATGPARAALDLLADLVRRELRSDLDEPNAPVRKTYPPRRPANSASLMATTAAISP